MKQLGFSLIAGAGSLALMLWGTANALANIVSNPSFEAFTGSFGSDGGVQLVTGSTALTGWSIVGGDIAVLKTQNSYNLTPADGVNFLDLSGYSNSGFPKGVSQTLSGLVAGQPYAFAMDLGIRNGACASGANICHGPIQVRASIGSTSQTFTYNSVILGNTWGAFGFDFTATGSSMSLAIQGVSVPPGNAYIGLDKISVAAIPEPAVTWLFGVGLLLLGAVMIGRDSVAGRIVPS